MGDFWKGGWFLLDEAISGFECGVSTDDEQLKKVKSSLQEAGCKIDKSKCSSGDGEGDKPKLYISLIIFPYVVEFYFIQGGINCSNEEISKLQEVPSSADGITCTLIPKSIGNAMLQEVEVQKKWCVEELIQCWTVQGWYKKSISIIHILTYTWHFQDTSL